MMKAFQLFYEYGKKRQPLGIMFFNGKFLFQLNENVDIELWMRHGIIPVNKKTRKIESDDLFAYINSRLPIELRTAKKNEKIEYIKKSGLRTPSDKFVFEAVDHVGT